MLKKLVPLVAIVLLTLSFAGYKLYDISTVYKTVTEQLFVPGSQVIYNQMLFTEEGNFEVYEPKEEELQAYKELYQGMFIDLKNEILGAKFEKEKQVDIVDNCITLENNDISISIYENGGVLVQKGDKYYGYKTNIYSDLREIVEKRLKKYNSRDELEWYMMIEI